MVLYALGCWSLSWHLLVDMDAQVSACPQNFDFHSFGRYIWKNYSWKKWLGKCVKDGKCVGSSISHDLKIRLKIFRYICLLEPWNRKTNLKNRWEKMSLVFAGPIVQSTKKVLNKNNTCVVALLMFYENRKIVIFKVLGSFIYCIIDKYVW